MDKNNIPCDCNGKIDELTKRIDELELSLNKHLIFNTEQVERGGKIYNQRIPNIHKLVKRIEELEKKQETIDSIDKRLINVECALYNHIIGNAESAEPGIYETTSQCECKQKTEPVEPAEWTPEVGKLCLYGKHKCMLVEIDDHTTDVSMPYKNYIVYTYEHREVYHAIRDELKPIPEEESIAWRIMGRL